MSPEIIASSIAAVLTALGIREWGPGIVAWISGRQERQKNRVDQLVDQVRKSEDDADASDWRADMEAQDRRSLQEYASQLRSVLIASGHDPSKLPAQPQVGLWRLEQMPSPRTSRKQEK